METRPATALVIECVGQNHEPANFGVNELFAGKALKGWGYREVWAVNEWELLDANFDRYVTNRYDVSKARKRWSAEASVEVDNHQTFFVEVRVGVRVYVTFTDNMVWIGRNWNFHV